MNPRKIVIFIFNFELAAKFNQLASSKYPINYFKLYLLYQS